MGDAEVWGQMDAASRPTSLLRTAPAVSKGAEISFHR
jgi:hypothetical protein